MTLSRGGSHVQQPAAGVQVRWHRSLETVASDAPAIYIAHEFFDALPVHQFQRTDRHRAS